MNAVQMYYTELWNQRGQDFSYCEMARPSDSFVKYFLNAQEA